MIAEINKFANLILAKAVADEVFRARLLAAPREAIEDLLGSQLPADLEICVVQETARKVVLVLPAEPSRDGALEDSELDILGGEIPLSYVCP